MASHEAFAAEHGLGLPLLADTDKAVAEAYGVLGPLGELVVAKAKKTLD